jgi:hypothetical protein
MNVDTMAAAVHAYFTGERLEGFAILAFSAGLVIVAAGLHAAGRDGFSRGFGGVALVVAALLAAMVISLMRRDAPHEATLVAGLRGADAKAIVAAEAGRMAVVIGKYPHYRIGALGFGALALAAVALSRRGWVNGAAAGVLLLVIAQVVIDHYSESRAVRYAGQLRAGVAAQR